MALAQYSELFWFPSGELAASVTARVFLHSSNTFATLWGDAGGTVPLANPLSTSTAGRLEFWVEEGEYWVHIDSEAFEIAVGAATESATLADIAAAVSAHSADTTDVHGITSTADLETQAGAQTKANAAQTAAITAAATDATNKVTAHTGASDPHGDRAYADNKFATQLDLTALGGTVNNLAITVAAIDGFLGDALIRIQAIEQGTAFLAGGHYTAAVELVDSAQPVSNPAAGVYVFSEGGVLKTLSPSGEVVSLLPAGGSAVRTSTVRVTDDNLSGLPAAASWTIVQTSAGTQLKASIAAAVGDRIRVYGAFMHIGAHFLDWTLLDNVGAIALYATTDTASAPTEGNPTMYPSASFLRSPSPDMFTVAAGHINAGVVTVALAHQGSGTGSGNIVYAHPTYPWRLRLENIGPEPA